MAGKRTLFFNNQGRFTSERVWKQLTTKGFSPKSFTITPTPTPIGIEVEVFAEPEPEPIDTLEFIEEQEMFFDYQDLVEELEEEVDEFTYIDGGKK